MINNYLQHIISANSQKFLDGYAINKYTKDNDFDKYKNYIGLFLSGQGKEIGNKIKPSIRTKLLSYVAESQKTWAIAMETFSNVEKNVKSPFLLIEKNKLYALDGVVIGDELGISQDDRSCGLQIFSLYYLVVHLFDDFVEDSEKFCSKFAFSSGENFLSQTNAAGISFILHANLSILKILLSKSKFYTHQEINHLMVVFLESLAKQTRFFVLEKEAGLLPETILQIKQREVSGEATSFLADALFLRKRFGCQRSNSLKKALKYLGSLTQFTDDLRDYKKDIETGNANLLVSMEKQYGDQAWDIFTIWYVQEENRMLSAFREAKVATNQDLIKAIPWHPFFIKNEIGVVA